VKNLANQTASSTEEIRRQIDDIERVTAEAVRNMAGVNETVRTINEITGSIAAAVEEQNAATGEIARNVLETTHAAQEVSARIAEVSTEAAITGRHVEAVRHDSMTVTQSVGELRRTLVQIVRTSTVDVDRRATPRFPVSWACRITVGASTSPGRIVNVSGGGALIDAAAKLTPGEAGTLSVDRLGELRFRVVRTSERGHHLRFEGDGLDAARLEARLREAA
jgi:aerotaxis receptor